MKLYSSVYQKPMNIMIKVKYMVSRTTFVKCLLFKFLNFHGTGLAGTVQNADLFPNEVQLNPGSIAHVPILEVKELIMRT